ncbi:MAG: orotate phosphoribosyltransferase [Succinivibrio sp.]|nr:orotate phosphoribosyltransferase [Succinivibrio sp.]
MYEYQKQFIELALKKGALKFGSFVLKSGRTSPYFFNAGAFCTGDDLKILGSCYAQAFVNANLNCEVLFGPAYKGIPLACATAMALSYEHNLNLPWCFNRKEKKDHGEGGMLVGTPLQGEVVLIDDVITAGTAIRESATLIEQCGAKFKAALIALDRMEKGQHQRGAIEEVKESLKIEVHAIITFNDLLSFIQDTPLLSEHEAAMLAYREQYGVA